MMMLQTALGIGGKICWFGSRFLRTIDEFVFPFDCPICGNPGQEHIPSPFCASCRQDLLAMSVPECPHCAMPTGPFPLPQGVKQCGRCVNKSLGFDEATALAPYKNSLADLCLMLKSAGGMWLSPWLMDLVLQARAERIVGWGLDRSNALVIAVPLHWWRRMTRGGNQAEDLAIRLSQRLQIPFANAVVRVKSTSKLSALNRRARLEALKNAFRIKKRWQSRLSGKTILLVDDILTTGATAGCVARVLKRVGKVKRVILVTIARTELKRL